MIFSKRKSPPVVGIDISSTAVKLLELSRHGNGYRVESYAVEPLPTNAIAEKTINDPEAVSESVKRALRRSGSRTKNAAAAVPGSLAISKVISMPANLKDDELAANIDLQADQYIPYPLDEVNKDFEILGSTKGNEENVDVLLVASRSENVEIRDSILRDAGLTPKVIDVESYAMENAFQLVAEQLPGSGEGMTVGVIDVGATTTTLNVIADRKIIYTREQVFGGKQLTEEIMRRYGLSFEEAGLAKRQGGLPDNYEPEVLEPFKETLAQQIARSLQFFYSASQVNEVDQLILAGGSSSIPGIDELIEQSVGVPTMVANPFTNMSLSSKIKAQVLTNDAPALMIACGLALRSFD